MQPKNIAIITGQLVVGGAERQLYLWLSHLDRERFQPVVITLHPDHDDYWEDPVESMGIPLLRAPQQGNRIARLLDIARKLRPFKPDLVHGWHLFSSPYSGVVARLLGAQASLGSLRSSYASYNRERAIALLTERLVDGIVVNSATAGAELARAKRWPEAKIHIVPNAVETQVMEKSQARKWVCEKWCIPESRVWIGSMGRFDQPKRFDLLLDLMAELSVSDENVHLLLIGYGEMEGALRIKAETLRITDRVTFIGKDPTARHWLSALDIFCFPSPDEGLPNVVMEAAAAGVPVVSWRTPFLEELTGQGEFALLVEMGNLTILKDALITLINNPDLRTELGQAGRRHIVEQYSIQGFVRRLTGVYDKLLGINPQPASEEI